MQRAEKIEPSKISDIMASMNLPGAALWRETRGRKKKYTFYHLAPGEIQRVAVPIKKAHTIQTAMRRAARIEGVNVTIQNHGTFLLIRRKK
jgi:hypothetical protein